VAMKFAFARCSSVVLIYLFRIESFFSLLSFSCKRKSFSFILLLLTVLCLSASGVDDGDDDAPTQITTKRTRERERVKEVHNEIEIYATLTL